MLPGKSPEYKSFRIEISLSIYVCIPQMSDVSFSEDLAETGPGSESGLQNLDLDLILDWDLDLALNLDLDLDLTSIWTQIST